MPYFDSAYVAKCYLNDPDSVAVQALVARPSIRYTSGLASAEVPSAIHRQLREKVLTRAQTERLIQTFFDHTEAGFWTMIPVTQRLLRAVGDAYRTIPGSIYLRSADAIHLVSALESGERDVWTSDRHMLAAAPHFGLVGRSA